jgi:RNA polymerase sigma-70 factor (ECF subfamily)
VFETDRRLVAQLLGDDQQAFQQFYETYAHKMATFVMRRSSSNRAAAEDIVQNAMIRALRGLSQYRGEASLFTWLCQICRSELADQHRKATRRPAVVSMHANAAVATAVATAIAPVPSAAEFEFGLEVSEGALGASVASALGQLPARYVRVLELKYGDDLSVEQIGHELALTVSATQSLLVRAREAFRSVWRDERIAGPTSADTVTDDG